MGLAGVGMIAEHSCRALLLRLMQVCNEKAKLPLAGRIQDPAPRHARFEPLNRAEISFRPAYRLIRP